MTPTTDLGLSIRLSMFELHETGDRDIFLGPLERARAETGGVDQWVLKRKELPGSVRVNKVTFASLGYPLSVFNKNSTLKEDCVFRLLHGTLLFSLSEDRMFNGLFRVSDACKTEGVGFYIL